MTLLTPESTTVTPLSPDLTAEQEARRQQEETNAKVAGATVILALGNIASRILGLIRETALTFLFGASVQVDAFLVATIVPRAIYDLLIGGHINGAIVPVLSEIVTLKGREELWRVVSILMSLITVVLAVLVLGIEVFASQIVSITASGSDAYTRALAVDLLRITAPALIFMGLFAIFSGTLYALKSFTLPAFAGVVFNGSIALITLLFVPSHELTISLSYSPLMPYTLARPPHAITVVAISWLLGSVMQMALQMFGLKLSRLRFVFDWRHPALRSIALLYMPVMFSLIIDTLIIRPVSYNLASNTGRGSISYMNWATTLIQFPQGLVATAISLAILPTLASQAVTRESSQVRAFKDTLGLGLRLTTTLIVPAAVGLWVLANPIIALLFEHGEFGSVDTNITALALRLYLIGLPFAAIDLLLVYAFYARKDTVTPAVVGVLSLVVYLAAAIALLPRYGLYSLMIADSFKHIVHALISGIILRSRVNGFSRQRLIATAAKAIVAALIMGVVGRVILPLLIDLVGGGGFVREAIVVVIAGGICAVIYIALALLFHIDELRWLVGLLKRRILRA